MAHGALSSMAERKGVFSFLHAFLLSNAPLFYAGGLLWLPGEHSKDVPFWQDLPRSRERDILYRVLKNTSSSRGKNEWAREIEPLGCRIGAWRAGQVKDAPLNRQALWSWGKTSQKPLSGNRGEW